MALSPTSSRGTTFNGGTITGKVVYSEANPATTPVEFRPAAGATAAATDQIEMYDDTGSLIGYWDAAGNFRLDGGAAFANSLSFGSIFQVTAQGAAISVSNAGAGAIQITSPGGIGFFGASPAAKPAVAGAKLPSDVVLASLLTALVNLGLITDNST